MIFLMEFTNQRIKKENQKAIAEHLAYLKAIYTKNELNLFGKMPEDLAQVLAIMALGSPAIIAKRTLKGIVGANRYTYSTLDNMAYKIGNEFRLKFAEAESIGILDSFYKEKEIYWRKVLRYCVDGNLQSVLDEYNKCISAIRNAIGQPEYNPHLFRYPGGYWGGKYASVKKEALQLLEQNDILHIDWNALTSDAAGAKTTEEFISELDKTVPKHNSVVVLMHDAGNKTATANALPTIIK